MDLFIKTAQRPEDQRYSHFVLITHTLHRSVNLGAFVGTASSLSVSLYSTLFKPGFVYSSNHTIRYALRGMAYGFAFGILLFIGKMYNAKLIGWQERAWKLLRNDDENLMDRLSVVAAPLAGIYTAMNISKDPLMIFSGASVGTVLPFFVIAIKRNFGKKGKVD